MAGIPGGLGPLGMGDGVLDGLRVEGQLTGQLVQQLFPRAAEIDPEESRIIVEVGGDLLEVELFLDQLAGAPQPAANGPYIIHSLSMHQPSATD